MEFSLGISIFERMKLLQTSESFMQKWATLQLYFLSAPLKITPHMSMGNILLLRENICTSQDHQGNENSKSEEVNVG